MTPPRLRKTVSLWDTTPPEIKNEIFTHTDPLTRFLNNQSTKKDIETEQPMFVWLEALTSNWKGDLSLLPIDKFPKIMGGLGDYVKTKTMYRRLLKLRPDCGPGGNSKIRSIFTNESLWTWMFRTADGNLNNIDFPRYERTIHTCICAAINTGDSFLHIAMRNDWYNLYPRWMIAEKMKLCIMAGWNGHLKLLLVLLSEVMFLCDYARDFEHVPPNEQFISYEEICSIILLGAVRSGHLEVVPSGNVNMVNLLLSNDKIISTYDGTGAIITAAANGRTKCLELLLQLEEGVDFAGGNNFGIRVAAEKGYHDVVRLLLSVISHYIEGS
ncbi:hypothetical protein HDU76_002302 [Blyttiomyces sp. JEL0837]|nr:hypothetical protein HDU76_002302 [Blyttiomyces sp. JEL0837]